MEQLTDFVRARWVESTAVVLASIGAIEGMLLGDPPFGVSSGPGWFAPLVVPLMALPLLFYRRFPFAAPVATTLIGMGIALLIGGWTVENLVSAFFVLFLVAWVFGQLDRRSSVVGLLLLVAAVGVVDVQADDTNVESFVFPVIFLGLLWGASVFVRNREEHAREAGERARQLVAQQETAAAQAVEEERQRIARELHDVIAHSVSVMTVQAGAVRRLLLPEQERERQALAGGRGRPAARRSPRCGGWSACSGTRAAMPEFAPQPSLRTLDVLLGTVREAGLEVDLEVEGDARELPPGVDLSAYRLVQEALTNTMKYAGPAHAWVTLRWRERELELEVANNGRTDSSSNGTGHGLAGMRERVALCGGTLETGPRDGGGFVVRCHLPLGAAA